MRVSIVAIERARIIKFHRAPKTIVSVRAAFDSDEASIIRHYKLYDRVLVARKPVQQMGWAPGLKTPLNFEKKEIDKTVRLQHIYEREHHEELPHPAAAKAFIDDLKKGMLDLKKFLIDNGSRPSPVMFNV